MYSVSVVPPATSVEKPMPNTSSEPGELQLVVVQASDDVSTLNSSPEL